MYKKKGLLRGTVYYHSEHTALLCLLRRFDTVGWFFFGVFFLRSRSPWLRTQSCLYVCFFIKSAFSPHKQDNAKYVYKRTFTGLPQPTFNIRKYWHYFTCIFNLSVLVSFPANHTVRTFQIALA